GEFSIIREIVCLALSSRLGLISLASILLLTSSAIIMSDPFLFIFCVPSGSAKPATASTHRKNAVQNNKNLILNFRGEYCEVSSFTSAGSPNFLAVFFFHVISK